MRRVSDVFTAIFENRQYAGPGTAHLVAHWLAHGFLAARTIPVELHQNLALLVDDQCVFAMLQAIPQELFDHIVNEDSICTKRKASSLGSSNTGADVTTIPQTKYSVAEQIVVVFINTVFPIDATAVAVGPTHQRHFLPDTVPVISPSAAARYRPETGRDCLLSCRSALDPPPSS